MSKTPLTESEVYDLLHEFSTRLLKARGDTVAGETTLRTTERAVISLQMSLLVIMDKSAKLGES